jgi:predicted nuclease of predicted toxin-antitoxin system
LLAQSLSEERFVIPHDADFGRLIVNRNELFFGVIYLRLKDLRTENVIRVLKDVIKLKLDVETGTIVVIGEKKVRIRKI